MDKTVCVVYHSGYGHTAKQAAAVGEGVAAIDGVNCQMLEAAALLEENASGWQQLDEADAIIFGAPTYMGSAAAVMKQFMELTSTRWLEQKWVDKLAAGFTNSGSHNGDKQNTLVEFLTFAAQHGMVWINLNVLPGNNSSTGSPDDLNRLGSTLGAMAQSQVDLSADEVPPRSDLATAHELGARVARSVLRWVD